MMGDVGTWKRITDEPLETKLTLQTSRETVRLLRERAGKLGVSATELARKLIIDGLEREASEGEQP